MIGISPIHAQSAQVLAFWARYGAEEVQPILDVYNARLQSAGKPVQWQYTEIDSADLAIRLGAGQLPDTVAFDLVDGPQLTASGLLLDITDRFDALEYRDSVNRKILVLGSADGKVYAIPLLADVSVLVYNKALFRAAGLDPEHGLATWDDLRTDAHRLTENGVMGYELWCGSGGWLMFTTMPFAWANGGQLLSADGT